MKRASLLSIVLSVILALATVQMAYARGQMAGAMLVELCADGTSVTVQLDASGQPIRMQHPCPDCMMSGGAALIPAVIAPVRVSDAGRRVLPFVNRVARSAVTPEQMARGPPWEPFVSF